jgi:hypothetical protein
MEKLIKAVYKKWKARYSAKGEHPDEETLACFLESKLPPDESERVKSHLVSCEQCSDALAIILKTSQEELREVPEELLARVRQVLDSQTKESLMEIALRLKQKALELLNTTGDILVGQEFVPAAVLRSRSIKDFKDEVTVLKDFQNIRLEAKIENKGGNAFNVIITVKEKETQKLLKDLRITLIRDDLELESYLCDSGSVTFEHVLLGKYMIEISDLEEKLASVVLDVKA